MKNSHNSQNNKVNFFLAKILLLLLPFIFLDANVYGQVCNTEFNALSVGGCVGCGLPVVFAPLELLHVRSFNGLYCGWVNPAVRLDETGHSYFALYSLAGQAVPTQHCLFAVTGDVILSGEHGTFDTTVASNIILTSRTSTGAIYLATQDQRRMTVLSNGNVGIGNISPSQLLEVANGNLLLSRAGAITPGQLQFQGNGVGKSTFKAGAQGSTNINYTLPILASTSSALLLSDTSSNLSWLNSGAGNNGGLLCVASGNPSWMSPGSAGAMLCIASGSPSWMSPGSNGAILTVSSGTPSWLSAGTSGQILMIPSGGGAPVWTAQSALSNQFVQYDINTTQNVSTTRGNFLFNVAYDDTHAAPASAAGALITSKSGTSGNHDANGLKIVTSAHGIGNSTGLEILTDNSDNTAGVAIGSYIDCHGGSSGYSTGLSVYADGNGAVTTGLSVEVGNGTAAIFSGGNVLCSGRVGINQSNPTQLLEVKDGNLLLSNSGSAHQLQLQGTSTGVTTLQAGAQGTTNINYTLPTAAPTLNALLTSDASGNMAWTTLTLANFVQYGGSSEQNTLTDRTKKLFNVAYSGTTNGNAAGAVITSVRLGTTNFSATGLTISATAGGTGVAKGLMVSVSGGTNPIAASFDGGMVVIGTGGTVVSAPPNRLTKTLMLEVDGAIYTKEILCSLYQWPDYVFNPDYKLMPLAELEKSVKENKHLPDMPSAKEVETGGLNMGEVEGKLVKKVEELTLYIIEQEKRIKALEEENKAYKNSK